MANFTKQIQKAGLLAVLLIGITIVSNAQTGIYYYENPSNTYTNNKLVGLTEAPNQEIYLLGKLSTPTYEKSIPYFCRTDKRGNLLIHKAIEKKFVYDLNDIFILSSQQVKVFGNRKQGPINAPWWLTLSTRGEVKNEKSDYVVYSTILNDACSVNGEEVVLAETKVDQSKKYNINLIRLNANTDQTIWTKQIVSQQNEEASKIIRLKDGNFLVLGKKYSSDLSDFSPVLYKVDQTGKSMWRVSIEVPNNFFAQDIAEGKNGQIMYMCSYSKEYMGSNETRVVKLDNAGEKISYNVVVDISSNGILVKEDGAPVLYGSNIKVHKNRPITKGKYVVLTADLKVQYEHELGRNDKPDAEMPADVADNLPTNSDFTEGVILSDGRIALAGRIHMPANPAKANPYGTDRNNFALMVIMNPNGRY